MPSNLRKNEHASGYFGRRLFKKSPILPEEGFGAAKAVRNSEDHPEAYLQFQCNPVDPRSYIQMPTEASYEGVRLRSELSSAGMYDEIFVMGTSPRILLILYL